MKNLYKAVIAAGFLGAVTTVSALAGPVEDRKALMKDVVKSIKIAVPMAKGEAPYDKAAAMAAMESIADIPDKFVKLFPAGSDKHDKSEAAPKIWTDMKDFMAKADDMKAAIEKTRTAAGEGQAAFKTALFGSLVKTCKACHDTYRIKKN